MKQLDKILTAIARKHLGIDTLEPAGRTTSTSTSYPSGVSVPPLKPPTWAVTNRPGQRPPSYWRPSNTSGPR